MAVFSCVCFFLFYMSYSLLEIETQLKKRLPYYYRWGRKQNDQWDALTGFIYDTFLWEELVLKMAAIVNEKQLDKRELFNYASNRWYNFWSAVAVEEIFTSLNGVTATANAKDRTKDFSVFGIDFDHKTTVFPKGFGKSLEYTNAHPRELIQWLYTHQSSQQRQHFKNRLFIVVYDKNGEHWKIKCELSLLQYAIEKYISNFNPKQLQTFTFTPQNQTLSDLIWVIE